MTLAQQCIYNYVCYHCITDIPNTIWQKLNCTKSLYFHPNYLSALANNHPEIQFYYLVLNDHDHNPIAFATIQIVNFYLDSVQNDMQSVVEKVKTVGKNLRIINPKKPFKILMCGNAFVSGEHGVFIKNGLDKNEIIKEIAKAVAQFVKADPVLRKQVSAYMLKDFEYESLNITDELHHYDFYSFQVEPNMKLLINASWSSFDDYLAAMRTKFRVKAKRALELSFPLTTLEITQDNIEQYLPRMITLYKAVTASAGFNLGDFNLKTYKDLKNKLGENYNIKAYFLKDKLVGFLSALHNTDSLDAHFVGIDYKYNREFAIYQRMLYDYVQLGINKKVSIVNFGRTASEIKSSIGAIAQPLTIYVRHKKTLPNKILKPFLKRIAPTPFRVSKVFKEV